MIYRNEQTIIEQIIKMKKNLMRMVAATLMFCCAANVQAAGDETNGHAYFTKAELSTPVIM